MTGDAVRLEGVTKRYKRGGVNQGYDSLGRVLASVPGRLRDRIARRPSARATTGKLALADVSLTVREGESFGLVGANGAGKSTALRIVSRITPPTSGTVRVRGRVGALIEVSAGVHFELTGRENIWLYGAIIGLSKAEIRRRFDEIVEFSELSRDLDTQVKYYSSGMQLRLGFSIASHLEPDVFVVDEALSVGDAAFQSRCVERMTKLSQRGSTLLFVSHHLHTVEALCQRAALLDAGRVLEVDDARSVVARHREAMENRRQLPAEEPGELRTPLRVVGASCHGRDGAERTRFRTGEPLEVRLRFEADAPTVRPHVVVGVTDGRPDMLLEYSMLRDDAAPDVVPPSWECRLSLPEVPLRPRLYHVWCNVYSANKAGRLCRWREVASFRVVGDDDSAFAGPVGGTPGAIVTPYAWAVDGVASPALDGGQR